jgi:hypothetical protein
MAKDDDGNALTYTIVTQPANGALSGTAPNLTYTPAANYNGADSFTYKVNDGQVDSNTATVAIAINAVNDAPVLEPIADQTLDEGAKADVAVAASDADSDQITLMAQVLPSFATFTDNGDGSGVLALAPTFSDAGTYVVEITASDGSLTDRKSVSITVNNVNRPPLVRDLTITTNEDTAIGVTLVASDPDSDTLTFTVVTVPAHGTLAGVAPDLTYTPEADYNGSDGFTYKANDGAADSSIGNVAITVNPVNDKPVIDPIPDQTVDENATLTVKISAVDADKDPLKISASGLPAFATFKDNGDGTAEIVFSPTFTDAGEYTVDVEASDGQLSSALQLKLTVNDVNRPPVVEDQIVTTYKDTPVEIVLSASDPDGDPVTLSVVGMPTWGPLRGTGATLVYAPATVFNGIDTFTFKASDGTDDSTIGTIKIVVGTKTAEPKGYVCAGPNLVPNGDFESGFSAQGVGNGWSRFDNDGQTGYGFYDDVWPQTVYEGQHSQLIEINTRNGGAAADRFAGIYQAVSDLQPGVLYKFSLAGMMREDAAHPQEDIYRYRVEWGTLTDGGTDWTQVTNWQEMPWDKLYTRGNPGAFLTFQTMMTPANSKLTVFFRAWKKWATPDRELDVNLDAITLNQCWKDVPANHPSR